MTGAYSPDAADWLSGSVQHTARATAYVPGAEPVELPLSKLSVTFDESWSPHVQTNIDLSVQDAAALAEKLDPISRCRVVISAGYVYGGGTSDVHELAHVHLRSAANGVRLEADSDEALAQDRRHTRTDGYPPKTGINELVQWGAGKALSPQPVEVVSEFPPGHAVNQLTELELEPGADYWALLADAANRAGVWVHVGDDGRWYVRHRPKLAAVSAAIFHTGPGGTLTAPPERVRDRSEFRNAVSLRYVWQDDARNDFEVTGEAFVPGTGRFGVDRIGRLTHYEERTGPVTQAQANAAAQTVLSYRLTQGTGYRLTAVAAYWLRPGMTVTVQPPRGPQERHLVQSVRFEPFTGLMTVQTREPGQ